MGKENEEQEQIDQTQDAATEKQEKAMAETFGYDEGEQESGGDEDEKPSGEQQQEEEEDEGGEQEEQEDALDEILGKHEEGSGEEEEEETEDDEPEGGDDEEEQEENEEEEDDYEPADLNLDEEEFEEITSDPEKFSNYIDDVREDAVNQARQEFQKELDERSAQIEENILQNIPEVVEKSQNRVQKVSTTKDKFFNNYPQLEKKKGYVRNMTALVSNEKPEWNAEQVLEEVGKRAERDLDIAKNAEEREKERKNTDQPKFAGAGGRQSPGGGSDGRSKQEKLMDDTFG